ncbi:hypothetical protein HYPSUDRAFT_209671 [Hypholoma sublateritium FD-334 SS-4]|uniref:Uncharacterized protein n=1 Tax=Hypholoma sublateritium (strain FD-334 SS-4) TaxID=945553 RepID=A0A0D2N9E8_HYPSF|nr:hypothetical protein HYPSUDRAFT_209671 [Hypholoma sublateritium FD-334 SS-4]
MRSGTSSLSFSYNTPVSPSPLQHQFSGSSSDTQQTKGADTVREADGGDGDDWEGALEEDESRNPLPSYEQHVIVRDADDWPIFGGVFTGVEPIKTFPTHVLACLSDQK